MIFVCLVILQQVCNIWDKWVIERDEQHTDQVFTCPSFCDALPLAKRSGVTCYVRIIRLFKKKICVEFSVLNSGKKISFVWTEHAATQTACLETGIECLHYDR